ncbi:MAG: hypothetical protein E6J62_21805 [Deltaproteobacteria bacterium]|nr:MAG: hypothetical protein E6J62_21805 [Deltaproteobacteria bacterium]
MRLCHRAGYAVPLLTISAILAGCATSTTDQPPNFNSSPQVVAVYAIDSAFGTMPDVLIYSTAAGDTGKISTNPPPSYGSYRVEFDQPINGTSVANNADRGTGPTPGGAASFCSPLSTNPFQLVDVDGGNRVVVSSVCYDATSPLGEHPHVLVVPGRNALNDPAAAPLTCNTFRADPGFGPGGNVFTPKHKYGIKVNAGTIKNAADKPLAAPSGAGWVGDTFQFTTPPARRRRRAPTRTTTSSSTRSRSRRTAIRSWSSSASPSSRTSASSAGMSPTRSRSPARRTVRIPTPPPSPDSSVD